MLYSPILSCLRIFPFLVWSVILTFFQVIYHFLLRRNFFLFYKIFFKGLTKIFGIKVNIKGRKWQDKEGNIKYFNSIQGWKIENDNDGINQDIKEPENSSSDDDLPF